MTVVRWAEGVFIIFAISMLMFLPIPPHGTAEIVSFVNISAAIVAAGFVWWGLRSPTRLPWLVAVILAVAWLLLSLRNVGMVVRGALSDPVLLVVSSMVLLPSLAQLVVLCAWVMASRVR